jgi:Na+-translocating ferredoxin:NAD+ oxidoreductase RnfG subunit
MRWLLGKNRAASGGSFSPAPRVVSPMNCRPSIRPGRMVRLLVALLAASITSACAERYLTVAEARQLCFPAADQFEEQTIRFTESQKKAIQKQSGIKVRNLGNRVHLARQGTNLLGLLVVDHVLGKHEIIDYAVAISSTGTVAQVEILEYRESHGMEIRGEKWREQFKGKSSAAKLRLNDDIYNISGATISCRNVTEGVKRVLATYDVVLRPRLGLPDRLPDQADKPAH